MLLKATALDMCEKWETGNQATQSAAPKRTRPFCDSTSMSAYTGITASVAAEKTHSAGTEMPATGCTAAPALAAAVTQLTI